MASELVERAASSIELDNTGRLNTPFGWRRAIDKSCFEVYHLDYDDWREVIDEATIIARYPREADAEAHAVKLQKEWTARAGFLAALDPEDEDAREAGAKALYLAARFPLPGVAPCTWEQFTVREPADANLFRDQAAALIAALKSHAQGQGHE